MDWWQIGILLVQRTGMVHPRDVLDWTLPEIMFGLDCYEREDGRVPPTGAGSNSEKRRVWTPLERIAELKRVYRG